MPVDPSEVVIDPSRDAEYDAFAAKTLRDRYMTDDETYIQEALARAAAAFADDREHAQRLYEYASKLWFTFATPLLANGGTERGLPISCFLNRAEDSLEGITSIGYTESAMLTAKGGGVGTYWGDLRAIGEKTSKGAKTTGVIPFAVVQDRLMLAFSQGTTRRGAAAIYLPIWHPEIIEWIDMRRETGGDENRKAPNLHNAVCIDDAFMEAVRDGKSYDLRDPNSGRVHETVDARTVWRKILEVRKETGEPFLFFTDTVNRALPQPLKDIGLNVPASNLCTEIMLPTGRDPRNGKLRTAVCCLSSVNLRLYDEWSDNPIFIEDLMRMLDNALQVFIDTAPESHAAAVYSAKQERSVGLGTLGFHDYLQKNMIPFSSDEARYINAAIFENISLKADAASRKLADERGEAPDMVGTGERFAHKMAVAPNASSSIYANNTSPSIEPRAANAYLHKTKSGSFAVKNPFLVALLQELGQDTPEVWKSIIKYEGSVQHLDFLSDLQKEVFRTAVEIDQMSIIQLAADRQPMIDQGQSVNLFFSWDVKAKTLHKVHFAAWELGLKTLYYHRPKTLSRASVNIPSVRRNVVKQDTYSDDGACIMCEG